MLKWLLKLLALPFMIMVKLYQITVSPLLPASCRFFPTCSAYAMESLKKHGLIKGMGLTIRRICRCHPGRPGGYDPVP